IQFISHISIIVCDFIALTITFPTRRSSDLSSSPSAAPSACSPPGPAQARQRRWWRHLSKTSSRRPSRSPPDRPGHDWTLRCYSRSEEHTSELQSRFDLVCRLLLENKKI